MNNVQQNSRNEYLARINKVLEYVYAHYYEPINLNQLAEIAHFSPFHFHRIFSMLVGETPADFCLRIRTEKAAQQLNDLPRKTISDIAFDCGFSSMALFARTFKKRFGVSASAYRKQEKPLLVKKGVYYSKNGQPISKNGQEIGSAINDFCPENLKNLIFMETKVVIKEMPEMQVVYCPHQGDFSLIHQAYERLMQFAGPRGLITKEYHTVTVYHDDPAVTEAGKVRQSACLVVDHDVKVEGEIGKMTIPKGKFAVGHFDIDKPELFEEAWNTMCVWLTKSGYEPGEGVSYEYYYDVEGDENCHTHFVFDICIPVRAL